MNNIFKEAVKILAPGRNKFDLSHERKLSLDMGVLVPIYAQEVLPTDSFNVNTEFLARVTPMIAPLYHRMNIWTHYFFVPNRIIWNEFEKFITGGDTGNEAPIHPGFDITNAPAFDNGTLWDYMGLPTDSAATPLNAEVVNALPFRAYLEIYNEYFRDQDLITKVAYNKGSGIVNYLDPDFVELTKIRRRAWEKDYFTSARPRAQKGNAVAAPVAPPSTGQTMVNASTGGAPVPNATGFVTNAFGGMQAQPGNVDVKLVNEFNSAGTLLIEELRKANSLQTLLEALSRGGSRYIEVLKHTFNSHSSDQRVQRPEYLGGASTPLQISEVLSTYQNDLAPNYPQGNMSGHGIAVGDQHGFQRSFEEHGWIIGVMSIVPRTNYFQGIPRAYSRRTRFDYMWPQFANLGEQEVKNKEVWYNFAATNANDGTFGYQPRYMEYRFAQSTVHGQFRDSLSYWTMAREFATLPPLNQSFIECTPTKDIFAITDPLQHPFFINLYHDVSAIRPLPIYGTPQL